MCSSRSAPSSTNSPTCAEMPNSTPSWSPCKTDLKAPKTQHSSETSRSWKKGPASSSPKTVLSRSKNAHVPLCSWNHLASLVAIPDLILTVQKSKTSDGRSLSGLWRWSSLHGLASTTNYKSELPWAMACLAPGCGLQKHFAIAVCQSACLETGTWKRWRSWPSLLGQGEQLLQNAAPKGQNGSIS